MNKPSKPAKTLSRVFLLVKSYNDAEPKLVEESALCLLEETVGRDTCGNLTDDYPYPEDSITVSALLEQLKTLPKDVDYSITVGYDPKSDSSVLQVSGYRPLTIKEYTDAQEKYKQDLDAYEVYRNELKAEKKRKSLEAKQKQLEALKKVLGTP